MNIAQNVERAARLFPDKTAILFEGTHLTYKDLNARVNRIAGALLTEGIARGDRVALYLPNIPAFVISYLATVRIGAIAVSANAMLKAEELKYILDDAGAVLLFTVGELLENVNPDNYPQLRKIVVCEGEGAGHPTLDDWLNDGPSSLTDDLPQGWEDQLQTAFQGEAVTLRTLGRLDLLRSKLFALCDRAIDLPDCLALSPSEAELGHLLPWLEARDANPDWPAHVRSTLADLGRRLGHGV